MTMGLYLILRDGDTITMGKKSRSNLIAPFMLASFFAIWMGLRPINSVFGDTVNYAHTYNLISEDSATYFKWSAEWLWDSLTYLCKNYGLTIHQYFLIIEIGYIFSAFWAIKKFVPTNPYLGILFIFSSLMFFTFGVNGLRNGLACHIILLAMAFLLEDKRIIAFFLAFLALGIHRSVMLPITGVIAAVTVIREPSWALCIWILSIVISLICGEAITNFILTLGFDERMVDYATNRESNGLFSSLGFRWDFLLYSSIPILMYLYVCFWKGLHDGWYNVIVTTYLLSNAFWVIIIRISYTNRFAYLSWSLMPIMLVYPLCNMKAWENQDRVAGQILILYTAFTIFMLAIFW